MHVGQLTYASTADSTWHTFTSWRTLQTLACYVWSAWLFGEVYLWSQGKGAHLGWVDRGRTFEDGLWERPILNENPIFLRSTWFCLAIGQTVLHLSRDEDRLPISEIDGEQKEEAAPSKLPKPLQDLANHLPDILGHTLRLLIPGLCLTLPIYHVIIRKTVWPFFFAIASIFYSGLPPDSQPTGTQHHFQLGFQTVISSALLILLWEISSAIFTAFVSQPPLRRDQPLTAEVKDASGNVLSRSKDPNGSLLSGLRSRKEVTKGFAFWELCIICEKFEMRRKTIYLEVDRKDGSIWSQISTCCLQEITAIRSRIIEAQSPSPSNSTASSQSTAAKQQPQQQQPLGLPRIADRAVASNGDIFQRPSKAGFAHNVGDAAKSVGRSPQGAHDVQARARKAIEWSTDRFLSRSEQERLSRQGLVQEANSTTLRILQSPVGEPFRQTFARRVKAAVLGKPHSNRANIVHASKVLSMLCVNSLKEDDYGQVARSIPIILLTYTSAITAITAFVAGLAPHWTDVEFKDSDRRVKDVEEVVDVLKAALEGVLLAFGEYAEAVGITKMELREAREALGKGQEMREAR